LVEAQGAAMSTYRQQAIEDVAANTNWTVADVADLIENLDKELVYAVVQRERVLELEAENARLKAPVSDEEWEILWYKRRDRESIDNLLAARAKEGK
jgi:hypothetical protein